VERGETWWKEEGKGARVKELEKVAVREAKRKEGANEKVVKPALDKLKEHSGDS
jgi:proteasome component ECM29